MSSAWGGKGRGRGRPPSAPPPAHGGSGSHPGRRGPLPAYLQPFHPPPQAPSSSQLSSPPSQAPSPPSPTGSDDLVPAYLRSSCHPPLQAPLSSQPTLRTYASSLVQQDPEAPPCSWAAAPPLPSDTTRHFVRDPIRAQFPPRYSDIPMDSSGCETHSIFLLPISNHDPLADPNAYEVARNLRPRFLDAYTVHPAFVPTTPTPKCGTNHHFRGSALAAGRPPGGPPEAMVRAKK